MTYFTYLFPELDGDQVLEFIWIDPILHAKRIAAQSKYAEYAYYAEIFTDHHLTGYELSDEDEMVCVCI